MVLSKYRYKYSAAVYTEFIKPGASMESRHCGQDKIIFDSRLYELGVTFSHE